MTEERSVFQVFCYSVKLVKLVGYSTALTPNRAHYPELII